MSTSPSWFDQEKFSRLAKKVGAKSASASGVPAPAIRSAPASRPVPPPPEKETQRLKRSTEGISVPPIESKPVPGPVSGFPETSSLTAISSIPTPDTVIGAPPSDLPPKAKESAPIPSIPPLIRRSTPLPNLKPIFEYDKPVQRAASQSQPLPGRPTLIPSVSVPPPPATPTPEPETFETFPTEEKQTTSAPEAPEEETPAAISEEDDTAKELSTAWTTVAGLNEKLARMAEERDDARNAVNLLRAQLLEADEKMQEQETQSPGSSPDQEVARALAERDSARRDYANLREQFEFLKQGSRGGAEEKSTEQNPELLQEAESLRAQIAERDEEIHDLKMGLAHVPSGGSEEDDDIEILRLELNAAQGQIIQAREEASIAQRGLGLSQRALQETRDALREASEGASQTKVGLESLKRECSALSQQNTLLQAQHDQVSREMAALKAKSAPRS